MKPVLKHLHLLITVGIIVQLGCNIPTPITPPIDPPQGYDMPAPEEYTYTSCPAGVWVTPFNHRTGRGF